MSHKSNLPPALFGRMRQVVGAKETTRGAVEKASQKGARPTRQPVFKNGSLTLDDGRRLSVVIKNLSAAGAYVEFSVRTDLSGRVLLSEPTIPLKRWARVVWQRDGAAGLHSTEV